MYVLKQRLRGSVGVCRASLFAYLFTGDAEKRWRVANQLGFVRLVVLNLRLAETTQSLLFLFGKVRLVKTHSFVVLSFV